MTLDTTERSNSSVCEMTQNSLELWASANQIVLRCVLRLEKLLNVYIVLRFHTTTGICKLNCRMDEVLFSKALYGKKSCRCPFVAFGMIKLISFSECRTCEQLKGELIHLSEIPWFE